MIGPALSNALGFGPVKPLFKITAIELKRCSSKQICRCSADQSDELNIATCQDRRFAIASLTAAAAAAAFTAWQPDTAHAVQGLTAGRIPGVSGPGPDGFYKYQRPEGKSGGHGVGWSEIPRYSFKVAAGWDETPVSIADLAGTELDLRFENKEEGNLFLVVAPVLRFRDVGVNADVRIDGLGTPDIIIAGFAPEIFGAPLSEDDVLVTETAQIDGVTYYYWEVKPHHLVAATAVGNRLFMLVLNANGRQWRKAEANLRAMQKSFFVPKL